MKTLIGLAAGIWGIYNGARAFGCQTFSFARYGSTCYIDSDLGAVPGWIAGAGMVTLGLVLAAGAVSRLRHRA